MEIYNHKLVGLCVKSQEQKNTLTQITRLITSVVLVQTARHLQLESRIADEQFQST